MKNKKVKKTIPPYWSHFKESPIEGDTDFTAYFFTSDTHIRECKNNNPTTMQVEFITHRSVVDRYGVLFNPDSPVVFFLN